MFSSVKEKVSSCSNFISVHKKISVGVFSTATMLSFPLTTYAADPAGTSLISTEVTAIITNFANQIVPTVLAILVIVVPVGLSCWAIGFATKKALSFLQKKASKAI